ncbi:response regulator transcription factor [Acidiphilium sp. C61]|uniref:response regulator transcription factor n=1 Tax=Acidiphilium sp. C61 TaxID=1671485 RepID=UPI00157AC47A|nr:response regulator transcription factor [Acidiphilium sp. C61]
MKLLLDRSLAKTNPGLIFKLKARRDVFELVSGVGALAEHARLYPYDALVILAPHGDATYPGLVSQLKGANAALSVIVVGWRLDIENRIHFLRLGVDELVATEINDDELLARIVNVVMRKAPTGSEACVRFGSAGEGELYPDARKILMNGKVVPFTAREYDLVETLALRAGSVIARSNLMDIMYSAGDNPALQVIDVYVSLVRRKFISHGGAALIKNKRGFGYYVERPQAGATEVESAPPVALIRQRG